MSLIVSVTVCTLVWAVAYLLLFDDFKDFSKSLGRSMALEAMHELFPGFGARQKDWARPFIWIFSGLLTASLVYYLIG